MIMYMSHGRTKRLALWITNHTDGHEKCLEAAKITSPALRILKFVEIAAFFIDEFEKEVINPCVEWNFYKEDDILLAARKLCDIHKSLIRKYFS